MKLANEFEFLTLFAIKYLILRFKLKPFKEERNWIKKIARVYTISTFNRECSRVLTEIISKLAFECELKINDSSTFYFVKYNYGFWQLLFEKRKI